MTAPVGGAVEAKVLAQRFWIQLAEQWQKAWADAMAFWVKAGKPYDGVGLRRH